MDVADAACDAIGDVHGRSFIAGSPPDLLS